MACTQSEKGLSVQSIALGKASAVPILLESGNDTSYILNMRRPRNRSSASELVRPLALLECYQLLGHRCPGEPRFVGETMPPTEPLTFRQAGNSFTAAFRLW
jgi:hypothetical protein